MTKAIAGILLKADDGAEPMPIPVTDHVSINEYIGGHFDCVRQQYEASEFLLETGEQFTAVGYVHDEGLILGLPLNKMATVIFRREVYGDVVIVSGTSPDGDYDGENYDVPAWFSDAVFNGSLASTVQDLDDKAMFVREAILRAVREHLLDDETADGLVTAMANAPLLNEREINMVQEVLETVTKYHMARLQGMPKFSDEIIKKITDMSDMMMESEDWEVTDEELAKFLSENGGQ